MLQIGDKAPHFDAMDEHGSPVRLADFKGKKLILYFYPKDMTPGCTVQANNLNDHLDELRSQGFEVIGVSADNASRHCKFIEKHGLGFHLIADEDKKVINAYEAWGPKKFMGRTFDGILRKTFVIDGDGYIRGIIEKVKTKAHVEQILALDLP